MKIIKFFAALVAAFAISKVIIKKVKTTKRRVINNIKQSIS